MAISAFLEIRGGWIACQLRRYPTLEDSPAGFPCRPATLSLSLSFAPWRTPAPASSASLEVTSQVSPPPTAALPDSSPAPPHSNARTVSVRVWMTPTLPPVVSSSSSVANPYVSSPLHSALLSALSSQSVPFTRYFSPALSLLNCVSPVSFRLLLAHSAIFVVAVVFLLADPDSLRVSPLLSLIIPPCSAAP